MVSAWFLRKKNSYDRIIISISLLTYFLFILLVAFFPDILGTKISDKSVITIGIPIGVSIILLAFASTGIYVFIANREFDKKEELIKKKINKWLITLL